jgi:hypothetical protein
MKTSELKIFVITHKDFEMPDISKDLYKPLLVGADNQPKYLKEKYNCDNIGDNISSKNSSYCEMTGLYWIWKNVETEYIGLVHYRRYFLNDLKRFRFRYGYYVSDINNKEKHHIATYDEIKKLLENNNLIVKKSKWSWRNNLQELGKFVDKECINETIAILKRDPNYQNINKFLNRHSYIECNMFVAKKSLIDKYCEWIFEILKQIDDLHYQNTGEYYHNREIGYVAEILFGAWIDFNNIDYKALDVLTPGSSKEFLVNGFDNGTNIYSYKQIIYKFLNKVKSLIKYILKK